MIVTVTSPLNGAGKSLTTINYATLFVKALNERVLIINNHKDKDDIAYYLSNATLTKGLDEFKNMTSGNLIKSSKGLKSCVSRVHDSIDIMATNNCLDLNERDISYLLDLANKEYGLIIIDTPYDKRSITKEVLNLADSILMVLEPNQKSLYHLKHNELFINKKNNVVYVLNKVLDRFDSVKSNKTSYSIEKTLTKAVKDKDRVYCLDYDMYLNNECNDHTVLNYILGSKFDSTNYMKNLLDLLDYTVNNHSDKFLDITRIREKKEFIVKRILKSVNYIKNNDTEAIAIENN